ncbi:MAG TPA: radical SAM protein [Chloroflexota bacterium]|nr:radical SAM protein [Chloroflexota bacterium]
MALDKVERLFYHRAMRRAQYTEIHCKTALNRVQGMPFKWSLNPYRGCTHACQYCYARVSHTYFGLNAGEDFETKILVKVNIAEVLRQELARPSWAGEPVALGTATDCYQPAEARYRLTRRCLELFARFRTPISLVTKGTMVLRDLDVLQELTARAGATVYFSVPTVDRELWRRTEPGTPPPEQRLRVMERLVAAGIHAGVLLAPLLPGLSATPAQIEQAVRAAAAHGARFIGAGVLHLGPEVREHFLAFLEREYPTLVEGYRRLYGMRYAPQAYEAQVERRVREAKALAGYQAVLPSRREPSAARRPLQLALPLATSPAG